jgi:hypothetical protein
VKNFEFYKMFLEYILKYHWPNKTFKNLNFSIQKDESLDGKNFLIEKLHFSFLNVLRRLHGT